MSRRVYKIQKNDVFGRFMVANKNIKQGELILKEDPILIGPQVSGSMICFNCCKDLTKTGYVFCVFCKTAVLCNPKCTGTFHSDQECNHMKNSSIKGDDIAENEQVVFPLRCLLIKFYNPEKWAQIVNLEPHLNFRRDSPIWRRHKIVVEDPLKTLKYLTENDLEEEVIQKICGILDINTFEVRPPRTNVRSGITSPEVECLRGLYLEAALMTHDCLSNTHLSVDNKFKMSIYASVDIPKNGMIYFNYANVLQGSRDRKQHLREGKYFECQCTRCKDPSELGTELSTLKCHKCLQGTIRPVKPHEIKTNWECTRCKTIFGESLIKLTVNEGKRLIQDVDSSDVKKMEQLLSKLERTFHPQHYLILDLIQNLISLYSRAVPNKKNLSRKIELCDRLLFVLDKIEPGLSRLKAITMYELQSTEIDLAHKDYRGKEISVEDLINRLVDAEGILKTAAKYLLYEPQNSPEGQIAQSALSELKHLRQSIISIQKDCLSMPPAVNNKLENGKPSSPNRNLTSQTLNSNLNEKEGESTLKKRKRNKRNKNKTNDIHTSSNLMNGNMELKNAILNNDNKESKHGHVQPETKSTKQDVNDGQLNSHEKLENITPKKNKNKTDDSHTNGNMTQKNKILNKGNKESKHGQVQFEKKPTNQNVNDRQLNSHENQENITKNNDTIPTKKINTSASNIAQSNRILNGNDFQIINTEKLSKKKNKKRTQV